MHLQLSSQRFVAHLAFVLDVHAPMTVTSEAFQATVITIGRLASTVEDTVEEIASLSAKKGHLESKFEAYREGAGGLWK
jgi:hypothetical protein